MRRKSEARLEEIRQLLSHLHGEVTALESSYTQLLSVLRKFEKRADLDDLTGLNRRNAFFEGFRQLLEECQSLNAESGLLLIDIDHFKQVNDTHGHPTGDEVIKSVAALLKQYESPSCIAGRIGGEEFAVALKGTPAQVIAHAEFIRRGAERLHGPVIGPEGSQTSNVEWKCTLSVGLAPISPNRPGNIVPNIDQLISKAWGRADEALYTAKRKGRNRVCSAA